jgi:hypothetical protein
MNPLEEAAIAYVRASDAYQAACRVVPVDAVRLEHLVDMAWVARETFYTETRALMARLDQSTLGRE